jgi:ectoine hydroxylase-related dioxygenase (phytanoyl-CoA dioxygenase family)
MANANLPWVESPFFEDILSSKNLSAEQAKLAREYNKNGFVVLSGVLPPELINKVQHDAETKAFDPNFPIKTQRNEARVQDFWKVSDASRDLARYPKVLEVLDFLYGRAVIPFQTLSFRVGSQQRAHSDTIHFSSLPPRFMCGVWVALEDITEENGPVFYYPGSHKLPEYDFSHIRDSADLTTYDNYTEYEDFIERIVTEHKLEKKKFLAKKGDLLIWSSNIIHGGSPVTKQGASRWSQVTHCFFEDCYYYTPMLSNMATRELYLRDKLTDIRTGKRMKLTYNGSKLNAVRSGKKLYLLTNNKTPEVSIVWGRIKKMFYKIIGK